MSADTLVSIVKQLDYESVYSIIKHDSHDEIIDRMVGI